MSRLARVTQAIFGGSASNNGEFGSAQAGTPTTTTNISSIMNAVSGAWAAGWLNAVMGSSKFPPLEEFQGIDYVLTTQLAYLFQQGIPEWDAGTTYFNTTTASIVMQPGTSNLFQSLTDNNLNNALPTAPNNNTNWKFLGDLSQLANITAGSADVNDFRLTLTTGVPVTTTNVTGATTIYATPFGGNKIALYDGSANWNVLTSAEFSIALGTLSSGKPYDVFCYNNSGVPTLEILAWTNGTTRATALVLQNGVLVKSGATTRRYLGTFYTTATTTTEDSYANRYLWNYYRRKTRPMKAEESTGTWNYSTNSFRQANANSANQLNFVIGVSEDIIEAIVVESAANTLGDPAAIGIGLNSTTVNSATTNSIGSGASGVEQCDVAQYRDFVPVGVNFLAWLEQGAAGGTTSWFGTNNGATSGISGTIQG